MIAKNELLARDWPVHDIGPYIALVNEAGPGVVDGHYRLSEEQAKAILELRLQRLTGLERDKLIQELKDLTAQITDLIDILGSRPRVLAIMRDELQKIKDEFDTPRRTTLEVTCDPHERRAATAAGRADRRAGARARPRAGAPRPPR